MANVLTQGNVLARRNKLAREMTHRNSLSAGGGVSEPVERANIVPPWYQTLSGERAGPGFTEALQMMADQRGDMQIGDTSINPIDFINPVAGIFGGKLAKTADLMALRDAMNRAAQGEDVRKVWKDTGWFQSPDGQWRFEIDDSASRFNSNAWQTRETDIFGHPVSYQAADAGDLMTHDDLYNAYPDLRPMAVGEYNGEHLGVYNAPTKMMPETMALQLGYGDDATRSVMLHEYQHAIQSREGFARGGSAESFKELPLNPAYARYMEARKTDPDLLEFSRLHNSPEYQQELAAQNRRWNEEFEPRYKELSAQLSALGRRGPGSDKLREQLDELFSQAEAGSGQYPTMTRVDELSRRLKERGIPWQAPKETLSKNQAYQRLAGEAEARAVQSRMNLTPEQRRMRFPLDDYDVPVDELIMRYGDGPAMSSGNRWYHGTLNDFDDFDADDIYQNTFRPVDDAVWLTDSPAYASWINEKKAGKVLNEGRVLDVQADVSNPLKIDILAEGRRVADEIGADLPETAMQAQELLSGGMGWDAVVAQWIHEAKMAGHDALELANFHDNWSINAGKTTNAMLVFDPKKAKIIK